jgi:hypothetical protein
LRLSGKLQRGTGVVRRERCAGNTCHARQSRPLHGSKLHVEGVSRFAGRDEQIPVEARKRAIDVLLFHDGFHLIDRRRVAGGGETRRRTTPEPLQHGVSVIEDIREVGSRPACLAASDAALLEDNDGRSFAREQICGGQSGDARADNADIGMRPFLERRAPRDPRQ